MRWHPACNYLWVLACLYRRSGWKRSPDEREHSRSGTSACQTGRVQSVWSAGTRSCRTYARTIHWQVCAARAGTSHRSSGVCGAADSWKSVPCHRRRGLTTATTFTSVTLPLKFVLCYSSTCFKLALMFMPSLLQMKCEILC